MTNAITRTSSRLLLNDTALLLIRLIVGVVFVFHGSQKLFGAFDGPGLEGFAGFLGTLNVPLPTLSAWMAALAEFGGGLALILGLGVRVVALPLAFTMAVGIITVHAGAFSMQNNGMEYALTLGVIAFALGLSGAGVFSLDHLLFGRKGKVEN